MFNVKFGRYVGDSNKAMNLRAHTLYESCISALPVLIQETGKEYVNQTIQVIFLPSFSASLPKD